MEVDRAAISFAAAVFNGSSEKERDQGDEDSAEAPFEVVVEPADLSSGRVFLSVELASEFVDTGRQVIDLVGQQRNLDGVARVGFQALLEVGEFTFQLGDSLLLLLR